MQRFGLQIRVLYFLAAVVVMPFFSGASANTQSAQNDLQINRAIERELTGKQCHDYQIWLESGQFARVTVDQQGVDVMIWLISPAGEEIEVIDSPNDSFGAETVLISATESGNYGIKVGTQRPVVRSGKYQIKLQELRAGNSSDSVRLKAQHLFSEAIFLSSEGVAQSKRRALEKFLEVVPLWHATDEQNLASRATSYIGLLYLDLGEVNTAVGYFQKALSYAQAKAFQRDEMQALLNLAEAYQLMGDFRLALEYHDQGLKILTELGDFQKEARTLITIGSINISLGEPDLAIKSFRRSAEISNAHGLNRIEGMSLSKMGAVYLSIGDYQNALDFFTRAVPLHKLGTDLSGEMITLNNLGKVNLALGEYSNANEYFNKALEIGNKVGNRILISNTLNDLGQSLLFQGDIKGSLDSFRKALALSQKNGTRPKEIESLTNIGMAHKAAGDTRKALTFFQEALALSQDTKLRSQELDNHFGIGVVYASLGEATRASESLEKALSLSRALSNKRIEANTLYQLAILSSRHGDLIDARAQIKGAIDIVESLRTKFVLQDMRAAYLGTVQNFYQLYIDTLMQMSRSSDDDYAAEALKVNEMARARSLLDLIVESQFDYRQGVRSELIERKDRLRHQIDAKSEQLTILKNKSGDQRLAETIGQEITALDHDLQQVESSIRQESPAYAALTQPQPLDLAAIQQQVVEDENTLLLEYSLGKERSYLWAIGKDSFTSYELRPRAEIEAVARRLYSLLSTRPSGSPVQSAAEMKSFFETARELGRHLLGPVAEKLCGQRLLIVSDGALQYIPFGSLPKPEIKREEISRRSAPSSGRSSFYTPLLVEHEIIGLPSATTLAVQRDQLKDRKPAPRTLAVLADPVFGKYDDRVTTTLGKSASPAAKEIVERSWDFSQPQSKQASSNKRSKKNRRDNHAKSTVGNQPPQNNTANVSKGPSTNKGFIARLAFSREEAKAIYNLAPEDSMLALDFKANRLTAMDQSLGQYRYLHFALHGMIDSEDPRQTGLMFSTVNPDGTPKNGLLSLKDIYELKLPAELVVLSACQSGLGREIKGEGFVGLTRGFMHAGARRVVASLWKINDAATSELMKQFYVGMLGEKKLSPGAALKEAQMAIWRETKWQAPYFWAAFVLQGEW